MARKSLICVRGKQAMRVGGRVLGAVYTTYTILLTGAVYTAYIAYTNIRIPSIYCSNMQSTSPGHGSRNICVIWAMQFKVEILHKTVHGLNFLSRKFSAWKIWRYFRPIDGLRPWDRCSKKLVDLLMKLWPTRQPVLLRKLLEQLVCSRIHLD